MIERIVSDRDRCLNERMAGFWEVSRELTSPFGTRSGVLLAVCLFQRLLEWEAHSRITLKFISLKNSS